LHGVPFTLKDCFATAGLRTTAGHPPLADHVPQADSTVARRLLAVARAVDGVVDGLRCPPEAPPIQAQNA